MTNYDWECFAKGVGRILLHLIWAVALVMMVCWFPGCEIEFRDPEQSPSEITATEPSQTGISQTVPSVKIYDYFDSPPHQGKSCDEALCVIEH